MGKLCAYPGCKTGLTTARVKRKQMGLRQLSVFKIPKNMLQRWSEVVGCVLSQTEFICELHFPNDMVVREDRFLMPDGTTVTIPRIQHSLIADAEPIAVHNKENVGRPRENIPSNQLPGPSSECTVCNVQPSPATSRDNAMSKEENVGQPGENIPSNQLPGPSSECTVCNVQPSPATSRDNAMSKEENVGQPGENIPSNQLPGPSSECTVCNVQPSPATSRDNAMSKEENVGQPGENIPANQLPGPSSECTVVSNVQPSPATSRDNATSKEDATTIGELDVEDRSIGIADHLLKSSSGRSSTCSEPVDGVRDVPFGFVSPMDTCSRGSSASSDREMYDYVQDFPFGFADDEMDSSLADSITDARNASGSENAQQLFTVQNVIDQLKQTFLPELWCWTMNPREESSVIFVHIDRHTLRARLHVTLHNDLSVTVQAIDSEATIESTRTMRSFERIVDFLHCIENRRVCCGIGIENETRAENCSGFADPTYCKFVQTPRCAPCRQRRKILQTRQRRHKADVHVRYARSKHQWQLRQRQCRRLKQKRFFGMMRNSCGSNDHPDPILFAQVFRLLCTYSLVKPPKGSNVCGTELLETLMGSRESMGEKTNPRTEFLEKLDALIEGRVNDPIDSSLATLSQQDHQYVETRSQSSLDHLSTHDYDMARTSDEVQAYIAGYVARKCIRITKCTACIDRLTSQERCDRDKIINIMERYGGLVCPSEELFQLTKRLEQAILNVVGTLTIKENTLFEIVERVQEMRTLNLVGCLEHEREMTKRVINLYLLMRANFLAASLNRNCDTRKFKTKTYRKNAKL